MEIIHVQTKSGKQKLKIPSRDCDIELGGFQEFTALLPDEAAHRSRLADLEMEMLMVEEDKKGDLEMDIANCFVGLGDTVAKQLKAILQESQHKVLAQVAVENLFVLKEAIVIVSKDKIQPIIHFYLPEAMAPDIELLKQELRVLGFLEVIKRRKINKEIKKIKKGLFVLVPVAEINFESRMNTDFLRKQLPTIPEKLKIKMQEAGVDEDDYMKWINDTDWDNITDLKERNARMKLIAGYAAEFEKGMFENAHKLISHICVPHGEKYNAKKAFMRAGYFRKLTLDKAKAIINFFILARQFWTLSTEISLKRKQQKGR